MQRVINVTKDKPLAEYAELAGTFFSRMKGLLFRSCLGDSCALIIKPTSSLHTFFMRFPLDIVFLDRYNRIIKLRHNVSPFRLISCPMRAKTAVELPAGTLNSTQTQTGDFISIGDT